MGDYLLPNLSLSEEERKPIGVWGERVPMALMLRTHRGGRRDQRRRRFLKEHHRVLYINLLTSAKLNSHLAEIDEQAEEMFFRLVKQMAENEGVSEQLKATDQMA